MIVFSHFVERCLQDNQRPFTRVPGNY